MIQIKARLPGLPGSRMAAAWALAALWALFGIGPAGAQQTPQNLPAITLTAGMYNIQAEVAQTPAQRQIGLMNRKVMPAQAGMLFVFEAAGVQCFWMRNTPLPLTIAFLAEDGTIVNLADMTPFSEASHCSDKPVRHALEMNQGWFAKRGIKPGQRLRGGPFGQ